MYVVYQPTYLSSSNFYMNLKRVNKKVSFTIEVKVERKGDEYRDGHTERSQKIRSLRV